jgi:16S rRNA (uracil1498-N3)-methyltransferase
MTRTLSRLLVDEPLRSGDTIALADSKAHYLLNVMRLVPGDSVLIFNGRDGEWQADVLAPDNKTCRLMIAHQTRSQETSADLWLVIAPVKRNPLELTIEKATELGVAQIHFVQTDYTQRSKLNMERLNTIAVVAAEQSGRLEVPTLHDAKSLSEILETWPAGRSILYCDESGMGQPIATVLGGDGNAFGANAFSGSAGTGSNTGTRNGGLERGVERIAGDVVRVVEGVFDTFLGSSGSDTADQSVGPDPEIQSSAVLIGPEGGFSPNERALISRHSMATAVSLGPRILRAETAAIAALAVIQAITGDWQAVKGDWRN